MFPEPASGLGCCLGQWLPRRLRCRVGLRDGAPLLHILLCLLASSSDRPSPPRRSVGSGASATAVREEGELAASSNDASAAPGDLAIDVENIQHSIVAVLTGDDVRRGSLTTASIELTFNGNSVMDAGVAVARGSDPYYPNGPVALATLPTRPSPQIPAGFRVIVLRQTAQAPPTRRWQLAARRACPHTILQQGCPRLVQRGARRCLRQRGPPSPAVAGRGAHTRSGSPRAVGLLGAALTSAGNGRSHPPSVGFRSCRDPCRSAGSLASGAQRLPRRMAHPRWVGNDSGRQPTSHEGGG